MGCDAYMRDEEGAVVVSCHRCGKELARITVKRCCEDEQGRTSVDIDYEGLDERR